MYCPKCGTEYRHGFSQCSDCQVPLVVDRPSKREKYHVAHKGDSWYLDHQASDQDLEKWAADPNCFEQEACAKALAERVVLRERVEAERQAARAARREELQDNPFDPRTEISADAKHIAGRIVTHLWILFVLLPVVIGILLAVAGVIK